MDKKANYRVTHKGRDFQVGCMAFNYFYLHLLKKKFIQKEETNTYKALETLPTVPIFKFAT